MTVTSIPIPGRSRDITVAYLGELLFNAGFIDEKQRVEVDAVDRQFRAAARSKMRNEDDASPFKALAAMNLTDASGTGTRLDDFLLARLIAEEAHLPFFKIDALKLDVEMIESKISRPFARRHKMVPVAVRDGKLIVAIVNPFDSVAVDSYRPMVKQEIELRVSTLPTAFGEKMVMRIFDPDVLLRDVSGLGFYEDELTMFADWIKRPHGIILVTGPTGSGKTVTLYSALKSLASPEINITTIEDPIEMVHEEFNQTAVQNKVGITFASALRTILRQDPDIIMVGEIRDEETAQNAVQAALTGHLVFSTLHTNDSATSVTRLIDLGIQPFLISSTLVGAMAQRLVRKICEDCRTNRPLTVEEAGMLNLQAPPGKRIIVKEGAGCMRCRNTGYFGRTGIFEILQVDNALRDLIDRSVDFLKIKDMAIKRGMRTLRQSALRKLAEGTTTFEEVVRVTGI